MQGILYPRYHGTAAASTAPYALDSASSGARIALAAAKGRGELQAVLAPHEAAPALVAALPGLAGELPLDLSAQVLAQTWGLMPSADWATGLRGAVAAAASAAAPADAASRRDQVSELLHKTAAELRVQLEAGTALPQAAAELLFCAQQHGGVDLPLQLARGLLDEMQPQGTAQLLLELARRRDDITAAEQMQLLGSAAPEALQCFGDSRAVATTLAALLYQAGPLPRTYLALLLAPQLDSAQLDACMRCVGLATGDTAAAVAALAELCNGNGPGRQLPLARYAQALAVGLAQATALDFGSVSNPEARASLEGGRRRTLQQLLTAVVTVLGSLRGMRRPLHSPLGAQLLLPLHDLAAVLCYARELLPRETSAQFEAAVGAALAASGPGGDELRTTLQLLPVAAAQGFGKGRELWQPLLHALATAGGMPGSQQASIAATLLRVTASQALTSHPLAPAAAARSTPGFADPAAVTAALAAAAANNAAARGLTLPSKAAASSAAPALDTGDSLDGADGSAAADTEAALALMSTASLAGMLSEEGPRWSAIHQSMRMHVFDALPVPLEQPIKQSRSPLNPCAVACPACSNHKPRLPGCHHRRPARAGCRPGAGGAGCGRAAHRPHDRRQHGRQAHAIGGVG